MAAVQQSMKNKEGYTGFVARVNNSNFSPFVYSQLANAYTNGTLNTQKTSNILLTTPHV
jgi:hypothetical protein